MGCHFLENSMKALAPARLPVATGPVRIWDRESLRGTTRSQCSVSEVNRASGEAASSQPTPSTSTSGKGFGSFPPPVVVSGGSHSTTTTINLVINIWNCLSRLPGRSTAWECQSLHIGMCDDSAGRRPQQRGAASSRKTIVHQPNANNCTLLPRAGDNPFMPPVPALQGKSPKTSWNATSVAFLGDSVWEVRARPANRQ
jgi:hypothetical protein